MPAYAWPPVPLKQYPRWHQHYVPIDPHTRYPLHVGDQPVGCSEHGIITCGTCAGTVEPWEPRPPAEGKRPKPLVTSAGIVTGPTRPAVTFRPFGEGCTTTIPHPTHDHALGPWRARRARRAPEPEPEPEPTVAPDPLTEAQAANRALAARLGITLPD